MVGERVVVPGRAVNPTHPGICRCPCYAAAFE
jgi:hypothetical protein